MSRTPPHLAPIPRLALPLPTAQRLPITAYFQGMRVDCQDEDQARRWIIARLAEQPEADRYGWFVKMESNQQGDAFDSLHLLPQARPCGACAQPADLSHPDHGPLCCGCLDDLDFTLTTQTQNTTR